MTVQEQYKLWLENVNIDNLKKELEDISENAEEINNRFFKTIDFGTAGLRGVLGAGTNYLNVYTIRRVTQGIANYMRANNLNRVAVSYDSRFMSKEFAIETCEVLAQNKISSYITKELQPTPFLSYMVRELKCSVGVMITASHNPAKYNGYKIYDGHGCQVTADTACNIKTEIDKLSFFGIDRMPFDQGLSQGLIHYCDETLINQFLDCVKWQRLNTQSLDNLKVVYTPLNGTGWKMVPTVLKNAGVELYNVEPQDHPDPTFATCLSPNPEIKSALLLGLERCEEVNADILIATDPDCDRVGVAVKHYKEYKLLSGNEMGILLFDYILANRHAPDLQAKGLVVKSIVSSKLVQAMANKNQIEIINTLTGFKYIGEIITALEKQNEEKRYLFGFEESYGYLVGTYVRDKEAVSASLLIAEMTSYYKNAGINLVERLEQIYHAYGYYRNHMFDYYFEGAQGYSKMKDMITNIRQNPFKVIANNTVIEVNDYLKGINGFPQEDVLEFNLMNDEQVIIRPSGTEPKIKVYITATGDQEESLRRLEEYDMWVEKLFLAN